MKRHSWQLVIAALFAALLLWNREISVRAGDGPGEGESMAIQQMEKGNLLTNGSMEEGFYWKYPNHFVANEWQRWWVGENIPEYDDVRAWRPERYDGNHAQVYFRWGRSYTAGIYQKVVARPCTYYQFSMYGRNHSNINVSWGVGRFVLNSPAMLIWHHERKIRGKAGVNFGVVFSLWDWLFGTAYMPVGIQPDTLGFPGDQRLSGKLVSRFFVPFRDINLLG